MKRVKPPLPVPPFYDPGNPARMVYAPNQQRLLEVATEWRRQHAIPPSGEDAFNLHLLLVDEQKDFCFPEGSLYVGGRSGRGAIDDNRRISEFIYANLPRITNITVTLDTHHVFQIFSPAFWVDRNDQPLGPHQTIQTADIESGAVRPNPAVASWVAGGDHSWLAQQVKHYCRELERAGRYTLYLWPPHCILGSEGHAIVGAVHEARVFHAYVRGVQAWAEIKGGHPLTEHYSALRPEVTRFHDGGRMAEDNVQLRRKLLDADAIVIAGQAASHCVRYTVEDLLEAIRDNQPALARKIYLLTDCMSSVTVPDGRGGFLVDFTEQTERAQQAFAEAGAHLVRSTDPLEDWPGLQLP